MAEVLLSAAAVIGDTGGYAIGWRAGPRALHPADALAVQPPGTSSAPGRSTRAAGRRRSSARFVPFRTLAPVVTGVGQMEYRRVVVYNVAGGVAWVTSMTWAGSALGHAVPDIGDHIHVVAAIVTALSLVPMVVEGVKERRRRSA